MFRSEWPPLTLAIRKEHNAEDAYLKARPVAAKPTMQTPRYCFSPCNEYAFKTMP